MMSQLHDLQCQHTRFTAMLIQHAVSKGYEVTWGETLRSPAAAAANVISGIGIANSLHIVGLAVDLKLFLNGRYLTNSEEYRFLGDFWKKLHPLARWGGDFHDAKGNPKPDGDHFSLEFEGRK